MSEMVDTKFIIRATCREHGHEHTEADSILLLAKDRAVLPALRAYRDACITIGADQRQIQGVTNLIERVALWQAANPDKLKIPDIDDTPIGNAILRGEIP